MVTCEFCGYSKKIEEQQISAQAVSPEADARNQIPPVIQEHDLLSFLKQTESQKKRGYGLQVKQIKCKNCGAELNIEPHIKATQCTFCGSSTIIEQSISDSSILTPESVLPFMVDRNTALSIYKKWLSKGWFHPGDLQKRATQANLNGIYIPFWTFDAHVYSNWQAEAGHYYYTDETYYVTSGGRRERRTRRVRKVRWQWVSGQHSAFYDDVLVPASTSVPISMVEKIYPFDTKKLVPYDPRYLSGWGAENYRIELQEGWKMGSEKIYSMERQACAREIRGDTYRNLVVKSTYSGVTFKLTLIPIWISSYIYRGKTFQFLVNGETAKIYGKKPISVLKVILTIFIALLAIAILLGFFKFFLE